MDSRREVFSWRVQSVQRPRRASVSVARRDTCRGAERLGSPRVGAAKALGHWVGGAGIEPPVAVADALLIANSANSGLWWYGQSTAQDKTSAGSIRCLASSCRRDPGSPRPLGATTRERNWSRSAEAAAIDSAETFWLAWSALPAGKPAL